MEDITAAQDVEQDARQGQETRSKAKREVSTIAFPYTDLNDAIGIARAIWDNVGTSTADQAQLSAWAGHESVDSGAFRTRMSAARAFGLITTGSKQVALTDEGRAIVDPDRAAQARVDAFLHVPLYGALAERYHGITLPSTNVALEADLVQLGVAEKQKDRARQVFQRSAEQAGFFAQGRNRLVRPAIRQTGDTPPPDPNRRGGGGGGGGGATDHPMVKLLVGSLPEPGTVWSRADRTKWQALASSAFDVVYKDEPATSSNGRPNVPEPQPSQSPTAAQD